MSVTSRARHSSHPPAGRAGIENEEMIACIPGAGMAKQLISSVDLSCFISEELFDRGKSRVRTSVAVVPDEKDSWRIIIAKRGRRFWTASDEQRLAEIQRRLRSVCQLRS